MKIIFEEPSVELRSLNPGDVFDLQKDFVHYYYIVLGGNYAFLMSDCPCADLENGNIYSFSRDTLVCPVNVQLMVKR